MGTVWIVLWLHEAWYLYFADVVLAFMVWIASLQFTAAVVI